VDVVTAEISALIAVVAAVLSAIQLLVMRTSLRGTILTEAAQIFWNRANREDRLVVSRLSGKTFSDWTPGETECGGRVAIQISQIALLVRHSYADREAVLDYCASNCVNYYRILTPLIEQQRARSPETDEGIYFEWFARKSLIHMRKDIGGKDVGTLS
jgi:hypothetical protein